MAAVTRALPRHGERGKCVAGQPHEHRPRCTRRVVVSASNHSDAAGSVTVRFGGRVYGHKLSPGSFLLALTRICERLTGPHRHARFRIVN
jgi:hypothetical protein